MIELNKTGKLTAPVIIAAFEGWNDAGEAASGVITHLTSAWQAEPIGAIDPEDYYDFQVTRPVTEVTDGATHSLIWPTTRLLTPMKNQVDRDVVLVHGIEPNMRWHRFCTELVGAFAELRAEMVVLLGALLADSPHTRPVPVSTGASDPALAGGLRASPADYKGPTGITGTGRVCGESASSAPSSTTISARSSVKAPTSSVQNRRQRMFGSIPWTRTTSRSTAFFAGVSSRVVGQTRLRVAPSVTSVTGRVTWKS